MIDMLFITDKKSMNFVVNYNMLESPTAINEDLIKSENNSTIDQSLDDL